MWLLGATRPRKRPLRSGSKNNKCGAHVKVRLSCPSWKTALRDAQRRSVKVVAGATRPARSPQIAAVEALGPEVAAETMPALALAKGLGKSESDGSLSWLVELDTERKINVNGIPFGKAPD